MRRGFTLIEMMVAVVIGAVSVVVAAQIAQVVIRQSAKGRQRTDFSSRSRLLSVQLRSDLRTAGVGSTGAVAVDRTVQPWSQMFFNTVNGGFPAIPVIAGANNLGGAVGGTNVRPGSDSIQIVVPNTASLQVTDQISPSGGNQLFFATAAEATALGACMQSMVYIVDHSAPTGAGRTQISFVQGPGGLDLQLSSRLQFTVAAGSDVMCARVSTYWIDDTGWLHRSDFTGAAVVRMHPSFNVFVDSSNVATDIVAPGMLDFQIAYQVSGEAYRISSQPVPTPGPLLWAFASAAPPWANGLVTGAGVNQSSAWFETRVVRFNLLARSMRKIKEHASTRNIIRREDGVGLIPLGRELQAEWITTSEAVINLRYFDLGAPADTPAEPF